MTWHIRLTQAREAKGIKKSALAKLIGVSAPTVTDWENGETKKIEGDNLIKVCAQLEISPEWLLNGKESLASLNRKIHHNETRAKDFLAAVAERHSTEQKTLLHPDIQAVIRMLEATDEGGRARALHAVDDVLKQYNYLKSLPSSATMINAKKPQQDDYSEEEQQLILAFRQGSALDRSAFASVATVAAKKGHKHKKAG